MHRYAEASPPGWPATAEDSAYTATAKAERLIAEELVRLNWAGEDLIRRPKSGPLNLGLAT